MRVPFSSKVTVERKKVVEYLLNPDHPIGGPKSRFFRQFGFSLEKWEIFANALKAHAEHNDILSAEQTEFGPRYEVAGPLECPNGESPQIVTVWQHDVGQVAPRLITAYPFNS